MISVTSTEFEKLKNGVQEIFLVKFQIGSTFYRLTNADTQQQLNFEFYTPGIIDEMDEIEITSTPKTNDINIALNDVDNAFATLLLSQAWMNKSVTITRLLVAKDTTRLSTEKAFEGYLSDFSIDVDNSTTEITVSSVWADYEKESGISTNPKSQQRYFPNDTAFEHSASAMKKIYWGKDAPTSGSSGGFGNPVIPYDTPQVLP